MAVALSAFIPASAAAAAFVPSSASLQSPYLSVSWSEQVQLPGAYLAQLALQMQAETELVLQRARQVQHLQQFPGALSYDEVRLFEVATATGDLETFERLLWQHYPVVSAAQCLLALSSPGAKNEAQSQDGGHHRGKWRERWHEVDLALVQSAAGNKGALARLLVEYCGACHLPLAIEVARAHRHHHMETLLLSLQSSVFSDHSNTI